MHLAMDRQPLYRLCWRKLRPALAPGLRDSWQVYEEVLNVYACQPPAVARRRLRAPPLRRVAPGAGAGADRARRHVRRARLPSTAHRTLTHRLRGDIGKLPFADDGFDLVTANMVVEHYDRPEQQIREIYRVLATGGRLINRFGYATLLARLIPETIKDRFVYFLQRRAGEDVFPAFYRTNSRNSRADIPRLAQRVGFRVLDIRLNCSSAQLIGIPHWSCLNCSGCAP